MYRKPTNKDNFIHFYSAHARKIKSGIVIGFFLRAIRICSPEYRQQEYDYIVASFRKLKYLVGWLLNLQKKAEHIARRNSNPTLTTTSTSYIIAPSSTTADSIARHLNDKTTQTLMTNSNRTMDLYNKTTKPVQQSDSVVYEIPCAGCERVYIGETGRGLQQRLREHRNDMQNIKHSNALVMHALNTSHLPRWNGARILHRGMDRKTRKALEAAAIATHPTINFKLGSSNWAPQAASRIMKDWRSLT